MRDLRLGVYDVLVGINLLREGLDLPEVSLVAILDADKEGYLRSSRSLIQTIGRAARHEQGRVIMYADQITRSMEQAIKETDRRRHIQAEYNKEHNIVPSTIIKEVRDIADRVREDISEDADYKSQDFVDMPRDDLLRVIKDLEVQMKSAAKNLEFEKAATLRDQIVELRKIFVSSTEDELSTFAAAAGRQGPIRYGGGQAGGRDRRRRLTRR